jgi:ABC-type transport system involved in multi-copper enzyme maturation permease subunit
MTLNLALSPLLFKEFRTQFRGNRPAILISVSIGLLIIALLLLYHSITERTNLGAPLVSVQIGQALFTGLALATQTLLVFLAPATAVNAISSEYEHHTFDLLLTTPVSASQILLGKLLTSLAFLMLLLIAILPLFSIITLFGGINFADFANPLITIMLSTLTWCLFGLFCSVITKQTYTGTLLCYAILISVIGGSQFAANLWSVMHNQTSVPTGYVVINPLSAMASALASTTPPAFVTPNTLSPLAILGLLTQGTIQWQGGQTIVFPIYRATWMLYGLLSLSLFWLSIHFVQPKRSLHFSSADGILLVITLSYSTWVWLIRDWWLIGLGK